MKHPNLTPEERAEKRRQQRRKWAQEHPDLMRKYGRDFYARNSEKRIASASAYYYAHKEERSAYSKAYYRRKMESDPDYLSRISARQEARLKKVPPQPKRRRDPHERKISRYRKTLTEYAYRSMESIQALYPQRVEQYLLDFPFDQYGHRFIRIVLCRFRISAHQMEYDDCYEAGMLAYLYSIHRCAALNCDYTVPYIRKMIRIYVLCALAIANDGRNLCRCNGLRQVCIDADPAGRLY